MINLKKKEREKFEVIEKIIQGKMSKKEASLQLHLTIRQINRLIIKYHQEGEKGFIHKNSGKISNKKISEKVSDKIISTYLNEYSDYNFSHFYDEVGDTLNASLSTVFRVLTEAEIISPEAQHKTVRLYNEIMKKSIEEGVATEEQVELYEERQILEEQKYTRKSTLRYGFGEEVQMDASFYMWFGMIVTALHLAVDKATKKVLYGWFDDQETSRAYYILLMNVILIYGIPKKIKTDKRSTFSTNKTNKVNMTQFERICHDLGIELFSSSVAVSKANVERENRTFKGRLKAELRHAGITTIEEANQYLNEVFIPKMNQKFSYKINESKSKMRENTYTKEELNLIISEKEERSLDNASSLKYKEDYYVLADLKTGEIVTFPTRTKCMVTIAYDRSYWGYVNNCLYQLVKIEKPKKEEESVQEPKERKYFQGRKPSPNHPWAYHKRN